MPIFRRIKNPPCSRQPDAIDIYLIADTYVKAAAASIGPRQDISLDKPKLLVNQITFYWVINYYINRFS